MSSKETNRLIAVRKEKLQKLRELGVNPYTYKYEPTSTSKLIKEKFVDESEEKMVESVAGRLMSFRRQGKTAFAHIQDKDGRIQVYFRKDKVGDEKYEVVKLFDIGDIVGVKGEVFRTHKGEITIFVEEVELLTKNVNPIPIVKEKIDENGNKVLFDAFTDKEERYKKRYLDLIINEDVKDVFKKRLLILQKIREFMVSRDFMEVETPILHPIKGGAAAKPFITHHNALDMELFLRIAPELYLKRLIAGGFDRVFEIGKNFRNEGIDYKHNPEFTMMELYQAYGDYYDMMEIAEDLTIFLAENVLGTTTLNYEGKEIDIRKPWKRISMKDSIKEYADIDVDSLSDEQLKDIVKSKGIEVKEYMSRGEFISIIFEEYVEDKLINPTFITDYPKEISPLTKEKRGDDSLVERFELFINGWEIGNAYSELNDPQEQLDRFNKQLERSELGDEEAEMLDKDFINMLEIGMPPTGGLGLGIDRLVMLLLNQHSIRDVIFFPQMRP